MVSVPESVSGWWEVTDVEDDDDDDDDDDDNNNNYYYYYYFFFFFFFFFLRYQCLCIQWRILRGQGPGILKFCEL